MCCSLSCVLQKSTAGTIFLVFYIADIIITGSDQKNNAVKACFIKENFIPRI